jgi:DNA ligase (NAD+)
MSRILSLMLAFLLSAPHPLSFALDSCPDLTPSAARAQVTGLRQKIRHHDELYYKSLHPEISDAQYDLLFAELVHLEQCFPALPAAGSPSQAVGSDAGAESPKLPHDRPMLSLSSAIGPEAIEALLHRIAAAGISPRLLVQPKVDGLPVELIYLSGRLASAATRGDGRFGEDVTARVRNITGIPQALSGSFPPRVAVRGEIYADLGLMAVVNEAAAEPYASPRHFAAGTLRSQDPAPSALAALRIFPFELVDAEAGVGVASDLAALKKLTEWGFPVELHLTWQVQTLEQIRALYQQYLSNRGGYPFAADGIVVKLDNLAERRRLGAGARAPFWAAAWKFPPPTATALVRAIHWQVGRTGRRTPVAEVDPLHLGGVRVTHVSLQNAETVARLGIAPGDRVLIALVADVIPQVQEVLAKGTPAPVPRLVGPPPALPAPPALDACLSDTPDCRAQFLARATHFISKAGLNIPGLGHGRLQKLVEAGLVTDLPSLFRLKSEEISAVSGFGARSARRLTAAMGGFGRPQSFRLVTALGIPGVGPAAAKRLARQFGTLDALLGKGREDQTVEGKGQDQSGGTAAQRVRSFFSTQGGSALLADFRQLGLL